MKTTGTLLEGKGLSFAYGNRRVLEGVDLRLSGGELVALVGPNGAGKSTLLQLLLGWLRPTEGHVDVSGAGLSGMSRRDIAQRIAFVPQEARVDFEFTARELVTMGRMPHLGRFQPEGPADVAAVDRALLSTDTLALADRVVSELSGGERQRVQLARALAQETEILLLDEPTASLDIEHQLALLDLVQQFVQGGRVALVALHDLSLAARFADRVIVLASGRVVADGAPKDVFTEALLARWFHIRAHIRVTGGTPGGAGESADPARVEVIPLSPIRGPKPEPPTVL